MFEFRNIQNECIVLNLSQSSLYNENFGLVLNSKLMSLLARTSLQDNGITSTGSQKCVILGPGSKRFETQF